jgi:hypothetical protein
MLVKSLIIKAFKTKKAKGVAAPIAKVFQSNRSKFNKNK